MTDVPDLATVIKVKNLTEMKPAEGEIAMMCWPKPASRFEIKPDMIK